MSHTNTNRLIGYWDARRGEALAPARADIDPAEFSDIITQTFIIGRTRAGVYPFRLAGGLLEDLHRRTLLGADFMALWSGGDRPKIQAAIESALPQPAEPRGETGDHPGAAGRFRRPDRPAAGPVSAGLAPVQTAERADRTPVSAEHRLRRDRP
jgi:hypothetical protein